MKELYILFGDEPRMNIVLDTVIKESTRHQHKYYKFKNYKSVSMVKYLSPFRANRLFRDVQNRLDETPADTAICVDLVKRIYSLVYSSIGVGIYGLREQDKPEMSEDMALIIKTIVLDIFLQSED